MPQHYRLVGGTLEIDGVRMHQTAHKTPLEDARDKVAALEAKPGFFALDVCTGLGYSAIELARRGCRVITIEQDKFVLQIAKENGASAGLFKNPLIEIVNSDAFEYLPKLPANSFDVVCHDPPRLSMAGELYSETFYKQLYRVLKRGGKLFHYTGSPGRMSGKNIPRGVKERLQRAGFVKVFFSEGLQGFIASKP